MKEKCRIKICGLRRDEDIRAVNLYKPEYAGFICSSAYWRYIPLEEVQRLRNNLDPSIIACGVFVDEPYEYIAEYLKKGVIDMVQLHGSEDGYYIRQLRKVMLFQDTLVPIIKAYKITSDADMIRAKASIADYVLLDSGAGTGRTFDWTLIRDIGRPFFLAGGLTPDNIREAADRLHPFAVDISSGVETDRMKDPEKIRQSVQNLRA
ncbi:MAG: phosphoribosylanthranilate isomerase [Eubacterium sp.]|nr:phosphoribosylanthranilate isomerase [Eubacterium sp.]